MTTQNEEPKTPPPATPPAVPPAAKVEPEPPKPKEAPPAAKLDAAPPPATARRQIKDDEEVPDDAELIEMTPRALKLRLARASTKEKTALMERLGVESLDELEARVTRLKVLEQEDEDRKREAMSEKQRLEADVAAANRRAERAESRAKRVEEARVISQEDVRVKDLAVEYIKPKFFRHAAEDLKRHLRETYSTAEEINKLTDKDLKKWFKEYVADTPEHARGADGDAAPKPKVLVTNGSKDQRPEDSGKPPAEKTFAPGRPNSASAAEVKKHLRDKYGVSY